MTNNEGLIQELKRNGANLLPLSPSWELRESAPDLFKAVSLAEPGLDRVYELLRSQLPVQRRWSFGTDGAVVRPDRHVRAFYLQLDKLASTPGARGCVAIKGTEPASDNFDQVPKRMSEMWNVFSWSIGTGARQLVEDWTLLNQIERFPVCEGKPPAVHPFEDAKEEADSALALQKEYFARFGKLARIPTPLFVYRLPSEIRARAIAALQPHLTPKLMTLVESQIGPSLGVYVYHYPALPLRAMHLSGDVGTEVAFETRRASLAALSDPGEAIAGWVRLVAEFLALGWVPTDPANFGRGYCVMAQNLVVDGGIVDVNSLRTISSFREPGQLEFAVRHTVRELTESICWYLVGTDAGTPRFQRNFMDAFAYVWEGVRKELAGMDAPPAIAAIFRGEDVYHSLARTFQNFYHLTAYRPQDAEAKEYR